MNIIRLNEYNHYRVNISSFHNEILRIPWPTPYQREIYDSLSQVEGPRQSGITTGLIVKGLHSLYFFNDYKILHISNKFDLANLRKNTFLEYHMKAIKHPLFKEYEDWNMKDNVIRLINRSHITFTSAGLTDNLREISFDLILCDDWFYYDNMHRNDTNLNASAKKVIRAYTKE